MNVENLVAQNVRDFDYKVEVRILYSEFLEREVTIDVYSRRENIGKKEVALLLVNDGQDLRKMDFKTILNTEMASGSLEELVCVGIHCGTDRMNEYGTACCVDYQGRGARAGLYNKFILEELLPFLKSETGLSFKEKSFAGFSLGGLSALDIVWNHPDQFLRAGVFSGSLWWRRKGYDDPKYNWEKDRIMHLQVQKGRHYDGLQFFFECGRLDETADRNNNGIIDSIEDTLDIMEDMKAIGYTDEQMHYLELEEGGHNVETWANAFPAFLRWGWGRATS